MPKLFSFLISMMFAIPVVSAKPNMAVLRCGLKPIPPAGSTVGACVNGHWQIVKTGGQAVAGCGPAPAARMGCHVGGCVNGQWQQICDSNALAECGMKPMVSPGCHVGDCVDGQWQTVCE